MFTLGAAWPRQAGFDVVASDIIQGVDFLHDAPDRGRGKGIPAGARDHRFT